MKINIPSLYYSICVELYKLHLQLIVICFTVCTKYNYFPLEIKIDLNAFIEVNKIGCDKIRYRLCWLF